MKKTYFEQFNAQAVQLFEEVRNTLRKSGDSSLISKSQMIPTSLYSKDKRINVVFAGQYSAGKSTLLKILTGKDLAIGGGITTATCQSFNWQGINVTDTPGIHTQNRPDHDKITYEQLAKADLIVFVVTAEGFSDHLANHFRKLINEKGKGHEMMLVVNKMDRTAKGNTTEQQDVLINKDILPVINPYSVEDMYTSFICTDWYNQAFTPKYAKFQDKLLAKSGLPVFIDNLNRFIADRGLLGSSTTSLYEVEKMLADIVSNMKTGDAIVDGTIHMLNEKRRIFEESKVRIKDKVGNAVQKKSHQVQLWGSEIANKLTSSQKQNETNQMLKEKQDAVDETTTKLTAEIEGILKVEAGTLQKKFKELSESEFARDLKLTMDERVKSVHISEDTRRNMEKTSNYLKDFGTKIATMSVGKNPGNGFMSIFKTSTYSGSQLHETVLKVGHLFGHKFQPWQAVRWTKNIANGSRVLGVVGSVLSVGLQIYNDKQEDKIENQLAEGRNEIRSCFRDASNVIEMEYDKATDTWIEKNITPHVQHIDKDIAEIYSNIKSTNDLYIKLNNLLQRTRTMISDIQNA
jgi:small GTP-binding protein